MIPRELEDELFDKMVEYYKDNPNVTVILERREGPIAATPARPAASARLRDRRRPRIPARSSTPRARKPTTRIRAVAILGAKTFQNYIAGEWVDADSGETFESTSPANGEAIGIFPRSGGRGRRAGSRCRQGGLRGLAARAGAETRRDPLPLRAASDREQGGPRAADGARDGQGAARGARGRAGGRSTWPITWAARAGGSSARRPRPSSATSST